MTADAFALWPAGFGTRTNSPAPWARLPDDEPEGLCGGRTRVRAHIVYLPNPSTPTVPHRTPVGGRLLCAERLQEKKVLLLFEKT